ncbi:membrane-bound alkaline phosphatase-like [Penaeus japonicus]|uniref:membrane-bound alkaline phosphatase-like n=1 Tax=Penaeus japonicus TaxID=27405 RepID=UPI001C716853|nr:membrane-bound alkaline phosphatase-like [Penaeus japonicus]
MARLRWFFCLVVLEGLLSSSAEVTYPSPFPQEKEAAYWYDLGKNDIHEALHRPKNEKVAKNVILFLGDGLGITVGTASRILKGQRQGYSGEEGYLLWERFPNIGLLKTYNLDKQVSDSAGTATAYLTGVKANYRTLGVTGNVPEGDCEGSLKPENRLDSILQWAQDAGKDTGLVTTAQVTHASPAGLYAKSAHRKWQCDSKMAKAGEHTRPCKDIARQLVEDEPGKNMNVIMGGGRQELGAPTLAEARDKCRRADGRDLVDEWLGEKRKQGRTSAYVTSAKQLQNLDVENVDYIMGLFGEIHLPYAVDGVRDAPSLAQMVRTAVRRLSRSKEGFFLMVGGSRNTA